VRGTPGILQFNHWCVKGRSGETEHGDCTQELAGHRAILYARNVLRSMTGQQYPC